MTKDAKAMERDIESALLPGTFVNWKTSSGFIAGLESVKTRVEMLVRPGTASRATDLFETFLAGCFEKAEEMDDSDGELGGFIDGLFVGWVRARQVGKAPPGETARRLCDWIARDDYGFCSHVERNVIPALDRAGRAAMEWEVLRRVAEAPEKWTAEADRTRRDAGKISEYQVTAIRKALYAARGDIDAYVTACGEKGPDGRDCLALAQIQVRRKKRADALAWVDRGLAAEAGGARHASYDLERLRRDLLLKLGRREDAVEMAWAAFEGAPSVYSYKDVLKLASAGERKAWHDRAMTIACGKDLGHYLELCVDTGEDGRLVAAVEKASDAQLEDISHFFTERVAKKLTKIQPALAARMHRALGMRIVNAGKSKYYDAALEHLAEARRLYERAGLVDHWTQIVNELRANHSRKQGFMARFEQIASGADLVRKSFIEQARAKWLR